MPFQRHRVLLVTRNFPPLIGGMEKLMHGVYRELSREFEAALVGPAGCEAFVHASSIVFGCPLAPNWRFLLHCQWQAYNAAKRLQPKLIMAGSGLTAPAALWAGRKIGALVAGYLHGLDLLAPNVVYQKAFLPAIRKCDILLANSRNTAALAVKAGIAQEKIRVLHPGVDLGEGNEFKGTEFREHIGVDENAVLLLSVGRLTRRKGIAEFIENAMPMLVRQYPSLKLAIIGDEPKQGLVPSAGTKNRIQAAVSEHRLQEHILMLGQVNDETLKQAYQSSNVHVMPVLDLAGDIEGFGMVAVEAAAQGLATVAFAVGGVPDAVGHGVSGYVVKPGDYAGMCAAIESCIDNRKEQWRTQCRGFAAGFSWEKFGDRLRGICSDAIGH